MNIGEMDVTSGMTVRDLVKKGPVQSWALSVIREGRSIQCFSTLAQGPFSVRYCEERDSVLFGENLSASPSLPVVLAGDGAWACFWLGPTVRVVVHYPIAEVGLNEQGGGH